MSHHEQPYRFIAVLNKKIELGRLMNALGHMSAGLPAGYPNSEDMRFLQYKDKDGGSHSNISYFPFIVLQADNSNQIRTVRKEAIARNTPFTDFTHTMIVGTSEEQLEATAHTPEAELEYFGICMFGQTDELREFTKKFSVFKS